MLTYEDTFAATRIAADMIKENGDASSIMVAALLIGHAHASSHKCEGASSINPLTCDLVDFIVNSLEELAEEIVREETVLTPDQINKLSSKVRTLKFGA